MQETGSLKCRGCGKPFSLNGAKAAAGATYLCRDCTPKPVNVNLTPNSPSAVLEKLWEFYGGWFGDYAARIALRDRLRRERTAAKVLSLN